MTNKISRAYNWMKNKIIQVWNFMKKQSKKIALILGIGGIIVLAETFTDGNPPVNPPIEPPIQNPDFAIQVSIEKNYNQKYSLKDFTGQSLKDANDLKD